MIFIVTGALALGVLALARNRDMRAEQRLAAEFAEDQEHDLRVLATAMV